MNKIVRSRNVPVLQNTKTRLRRASTWQEVHKDQMKCLADNEDKMKTLEQDQNLSGFRRFDPMPLKGWPAMATHRNLYLT